MSDFKRRIVDPLVLPLAAFAFVGGIAWGLSRMLLVTTKNGAAALALAASLAVILACAAIAARGFRRPEKYGALFAFVGVVAGGSVFAATLGIRPFEGHLPPPSATVTTINALRFEQTTLAVPADPEVVVRFVNQDTANQHNWQVVESQEALDQVIVPGGAAFIGPATRDYLLEDVEAGSYFYFCTVHPATMTGTLTVGEGGASPAPEAPGESLPPALPSAGPTITPSEAASPGSTVPPGTSPGAAPSPTTTP